MRRAFLIMLILLSPLTLNLSPLMAQTYGTQYTAGRNWHSAMPAAGTSYGVSTAQTFRSTSTLTLSGSGLPMAAATGAGVAMMPASGPRRSGENPFGGETIDDIGDPLEPGSPIGDTPWVLFAALGAGYVLWRKKQEREGIRS